jgi:hypothetical protein
MTPAGEQSGSWGVGSTLTPKRRIAAALPVEHDKSPCFYLVLDTCS